MDAAHIIPFSLNDFKDDGPSSDLVCHPSITTNHLIFFQNSVMQHRLGGCFERGRIWTWINLLGRKQTPLRMPFACRALITVVSANLGFILMKAL
jgi:hypothetical protein